MSVTAVPLPPPRESLDDVRPRRWTREEYHRAAYARAGIPEYWIINLRQRQVEVYRDPKGARYQSVMTCGENDTVTLLAAPHAAIRVADLLPPIAVEQQ